MKKRVKKNLFISIIVISLISITTIIAVVTYSSIPNPGHGGENVYIRINNQDLTLQQAIDLGLFKNCNVVGGTYSQSIQNGHSGKEIIVNVNGIKTTLQAAINDKSLVQPITTPSSNYSGFSLPHSQTANKIKVITNTEKTLQDAINNGDFECDSVCGGAPKHTSGYEIRNFGEYTTCEPATTWNEVIEGGAVVNTGIVDMNYKSVQGNWLPSPTYTETLQLNVSGEKAVNCGRHPQSYIRAIYRVWGNTAVNIKSHTKAESVCGSDGLLRDKINRVDIFQRQDDDTILINGNPIDILPGETYRLVEVNWNPADHGTGTSYIDITNNICSNYFNVLVRVNEVDEQCDSSRVWLNGNIKSVAECKYVQTAPASQILTTQPYTQTCPSCFVQSYQETNQYSKQINWDGNWIINCQEYPVVSDEHIVGGYRYYTGELNSSACEGQGNARLCVYFNEVCREPTTLPNSPCDTGV